MKCGKEPRRSNLKVFVYIAETGMRTFILILLTTCWKKAAFVQDTQGLNPFHYALTMGQQWGTGLEELAKIVPEWPCTCESRSGLYPFMLAATPEHLKDEDVSSIYGLLRFDGLILQTALQHERAE